MITYHVFDFLMKFQHSNFSKISQIVNFGAPSLVVTHFWIYLILSYLAGEQFSCLQCGELFNSRVSLHRHELYLCNDNASAIFSAHQESLSMALHNGEASPNKTTFEAVQQSTGFWAASAHYNDRWVREKHGLTHWPLGDFNEILDKLFSS